MTVKATVGMEDYSGYSKERSVYEKTITSKTTTGEPSGSWAALEGHVEMPAHSLFPLLSPCAPGYLGGV